MRSLRFKLILTFLVISVAGTLLTTLIVRISNERAFDELLRDQEQTEFVSSALAYYESNGSWQGLEEVMESQISPPTPGQQPVRPPPFALADEKGLIIIPNRQYSLDSTVPSEALAAGVPLEVDGVLVGTLLTDDQPPRRDPAEESFVAETNRALLIGGLGATAVAVVLAFILARTLTRPLQELAAASRQMARGNLQQEVPVRTQDELGELTATFNQMSTELERANQVRRQMTADIAHDLRTPLTVLSGYLEAMEDGTLAPTSTRLALMQQEVQALQRLVADLRTLSVADAGTLALNKEPVAIADLLTQVHDTFAHQAAQQEISIIVKTDDPMPDIPLDAARMRQALGNLVSNALRYTPVKGVITLAASPSGDGGQQIAITDTGSGIPESDLPHIFNRFYRGDRSRREGNGESGLGLAIAKSLVVAHNGDIVVTSTQGVGTTFTILLPG
jgi:signal transduction histidine kinase